MTTLGWMGLWRPSCGLTTVNWTLAKVVAHKKHQLPALKSGNAGSCILHRISGFDQRNFQGFLGFSRDRFFP
jgi:hypothetical protein